MVAVAVVGTATSTTATTTYPLLLPLLAVTTAAAPTTRKIGANSAWSVLPSKSNSSSPMAALNASIAKAVDAHRR